MATSTTSDRGRHSRPTAVALFALILAATGLLVATRGGVRDGGEQRARVDAPSVTRGDGGDRAAAVDAAPGRRTATVAATGTDGAPVPASAPGGRIAGVLARPGWAHAAATRVEVAGVSEDGDGVLRAVQVDAGEEAFEIDGLPGGRYALRAWAEAGPRRAYAELRPVVVPGGGSRDGLVLRLGEFVVEGVVTSDDDVPLADLAVAVRWWPAPRPAFARFDGRSTREHIDARIESGEARIRALNLTRRYLEQLPPAGGAADGAEDTRFADVSARLAGVRSDLAEARAMAPSLPPTLRRPPERDAASDAPPAAGDGALEARTDGSGRFVVWLPGPGDGMAIAPRDGAADQERSRWLLQGRAVFGVRAEAPRARCELHLPRTGALAGTVTAPPRDGDPSLQLWAYGAGGGPASAFTGTSSDGAYVLDRLMPGRWVVQALGGGEDSNDFGARAVVDVRGGAETRLDLRLDRPSRLTGHVVGPDGDPLAGVTVVARDADAQALERATETDAGGAFTLHPILAGPYVLSVKGQSLAEVVRVEVPAGGGATDAGTLAVLPLRHRLLIDVPPVVHGGLRRSAGR